MKRSRRFTASGFDALEGRVVLSQAQAAVTVAPGVLHGHKAHVVASDFARFQAAFDSTVIPIAQDIQAAQKSGDSWRVSMDYQAMSTQVNNLVNGLGDQLARQLHNKKLVSRIRTEITGAPAPTQTGLPFSTPSPGSMQATFGALPTDGMASPTVVNGLISVYQNAMIAGNTTPRSRGDFVNFELAFGKAITPMINAGQTSDEVKSAIATQVNSLGTQLSSHLGPGAQADIQSKITGAVGSSGVTLTSGTPAAGSLLATLDALSADDLYSWDLINDLALAYASSSRVF
jgi:hypothetical protein